MIENVFIALVAGSLMLEIIVISVAPIVYRAWLRDRPEAGARE